MLLKQNFLPKITTNRRKFYDRRTKKSDIEVATCTDVKQKWGKLKRNADALYEVIPLKKFCHSKPKSSIYKVPKVTDEDRNMFFKWAVESCPDSELAKHTQRYRSKPLPEPESSPISSGYCREILSTSILPALVDDSILFTLRSGNTIQEISLKDLPQHLRQFYDKNICVTLDEAVQIATNPLGQGSNSWLQARSVRITSSRARDLVTYTSNRSPNWETKLESYFGNKFQGCPETAYGVRGEPLARKCYELKTGFKVLEFGLMVNPNIPWLGCSHDGIVQHQRTVEFKCPVKGKTKSARELLPDLKYLDTSTGSPSLKKTMFIIVKFS